MFSFFETTHFVFSTLFGVYILLGVLLISKLIISCGYLAAFVIGKNAFPLCGGFHGTDGMGYLGIEYLDFLPVSTSHCGGDFLGDVRAGHYHRHTP